MTRVEFRMLGPFELALGRQTLSVGSFKQRVLLAMLVVELNRVVTFDRLVEELWGESIPGSAATTLRSLVSRLRRLLDVDETVRLSARRPGYVLEADPDQVDALRFDGQAMAARRALAAGDSSSAAALFTDALSLWRGPALADLAECAFARVEVARLDEARLAAIEDLAEAELALGRHHEVIARIEPHVAANPFRERAWGQLMLALYRSGRQAESLRAYRQLRRTLDEELGIEPSPALRRLEEQILLQRPEVGGDQVSAPGRDGARQARNNLPVLLSRFVGRKVERRRLAELLASSRLVTLTGGGGVGKTRLAIEVADSLLPSFPGGVLFVDLAPATQPDLIAPQVAALLGLVAGERQASPAALVEHLVEFLAGRNTLLVFDNCEHLVGVVGALVESLLRGCPKLVVLATSRERLGLAGETVWRLPSLSVPATEASAPADLADSDAVALFCDRAGLLDTEFRLGSGNAPAVGRICRRLDGIPLALELAAARLGVLSPDQIADRLDERFDLLTAGLSGAPTRHQTLRACMDWGHGLLREPERMALRRLSVFAGTFDLEAAEAVAAEPESLPGAEVLDVLARLVDSSWVAVEAGRDGTRFRLTESVRQYAVERLEGEETRIRNRHRDHFLLAASGYLGPPLCATRRWLSRVDVNYENLRSALDWCWQRHDTDVSLRLAGHLFAYWALDGRFLEGRLWLERALGSDAGPPGPPRVWALVGLGLLVAQLGDLDRGRALWREARDVADAIGDTLGAAYAKGYLGAGSLAEPDLAERLFGEARQALAAANSPLGVAWCDFNLGFVILARSDRPAAKSSFERALGIGTQEASDILVTHASSALGSLVALDGDRQRAVALADEAVGAARRLGLRHVLVMALTRAAEATVLAGDTTRAHSLLRESLQTIRELGGRMWMSDALQLAAIVLERNGQAEVAVRLLSAGGGKAGGPVPQGGHRPLQALVEHGRTRLAGMLDSGVFETQWREGADLSVQAAVDEALMALSRGVIQRRTFMFTDVVSSTNLAETLGDEAWCQLLRWHNERLRSLFAAHGGEEIKQTGDGFLVAFEHAGAAIECAIAIQRALAHQRQEHGFAPRVRIGLHEADATRTDDDYGGRGVHEAARIAALAGADEILVSRATTETAPYPVSGPRMASLKGISEPMELVTVLWR